MSERELVILECAQHGCMWCMERSRSFRREHGMFRNLVQRIIILLYLVL